MPKSDYVAFRALDFFFEVVMEGLSKFVDGEHYFDTLADDVLFEFLYEFPGWPRVTRGRENLIALYSGYGRNIRLDRGDSLIVHPSENGRVVTLEYEVHGKVLATGGAYDNRLVSIATIENRKIARWRDYMDSLAAWTALNKSA
ncbi:MAG TPA: nuclear transport factor 2 family protein [Candidatus Binataceae bacterium]|nr:nuclear transport factor 2 family protein [Candidatus Binataceae bacterium]